MRAQPPDLDELSYLFACAPTLVDPAGPWFHNTVVFRTERDGLVATCALSPSYSTIKFAVSRDGHEISRAEVSEFTSLEIVEERGREMLVARFGELDGGAVWLLLKPRIELHMAL
jgi:hypothetical protein